VHESIRANKDFHLSVAKAAHNDTLFPILKYLFDALNGKLWGSLIEKDWLFLVVLKNILKSRPRFWMPLKIKIVKMPARECAII